MDERFTPLIISDSDSQTGMRLGGMPPVGVEPPVVNENTEYFCTIPASLEKSADEVSLFLSFGEMLESDGLLKNKRKLLGTDCPRVQFVFHAPAPRALNSSIPCRLRSSHALELGKSQHDFESENHKIGGYPCFSMKRDPIQSDSEKLLKEGWSLLIQFVFPGPPDKGLVRGDWPFAELTFVAFSKYENAKWDVKYGWA